MTRVRNNPRARHATPLTSNQLRRALKGPTFRALGVLASSAFIPPTQDRFFCKTAGRSERARGNSGLPLTKNRARNKAAPRGFFVKSRPGFPRYPYGQQQRRRRRDDLRRTNGDQQTATSAAALPDTTPGRLIDALTARQQGGVHRQRFPH